MQVGNYLSNEEVKELIKKIEVDPKFNSVVQKMEEYEDFDADLEKAKVRDKLKFDVSLQEGEVISAKVLNLDIKDNISISYTERHDNKDDSETTNFSVGKIFSEDSDDSSLIKQLIFKAVDDTEVEILTSEHEKNNIEKTEDLESKFYNEFNFDENYTPGQLLNQDHISVAGFIDGCLAGGYIYCGKQCGGWPACESNTDGINVLDNCCKMHDCCFHYSGGPTSACNKGLCNCASQQSGPGSIIVRAYACSNA